MSENDAEALQQRIQHELVLRELARRDFYWYLRYTHGNLWIDTAFAKYLASEVQSFLEADTGNAYDILVIECPPQHGKSMTITESLPSWYLGTHPDARIIIGSYNEESAERFARRNKEKIANYGHNIFGVDIGQINRATEFELGGHQGRLISRGIMGGVTGNPANLMLIDDAIKNRAEADSETTRNKLWDEWVNSFKTRLAAHAKVIVIGTPWHESDYLASILATEPTVRLIRLPVEAEENDPLGRQPGEPLCPELGKDAAWLKQFKESYVNDPNGGLRSWTALYMCSPRVEGGNLVPRSWWKFYDPNEITAFGTQFISVDAAFKGDEGNDYVAIEVWAKANNNYYCRYCLNRHLTFSETLTQIRSVRKLFPQAQFVLIEDKANGSAIIDVLRSEMLCIPVNPRGGKVARVNAISAAIESGHVFLPQGAPWVAEFIDQFAVFPAGAHDDMCFVAGTKVATVHGDKNIEDLRVGDKVLTPFGVDEVVFSGCTGEREVITALGLTGTESHPVFDYDFGFIPLNRLTGRVHKSILCLKELILWKYRKRLYSTASPTDSWELDDTISASQLPMRGGVMRKDFMSRCGNFIAGNQFLKAMRFIISTGILLITTTATWSAYRWQNIVRERICTRSASRSTSTRSGRKPPRGTRLKKEERGIGNTPKSRFAKSNPSSSCASNAEELSSQKTTTQSSVATTAPSSGTMPTRSEQSSASVLSAEKSSQRRSPSGTMARERAAAPVEQSSRQGTAVKVYNITTKKYHLYYAGGILVHNCDAASQALVRLTQSSGYFEMDEPDYDENGRRRIDDGMTIYLSDSQYHVYGDDERDTGFSSGPEMWLPY